MAGERSATAVTVDNDPNDDDQNIDAVISGSKWDTSSSNLVTFSFPDSAADINYSLSTGQAFSDEFNTDQKAAVRAALDEIASVADVVFEEIGDDPGEDNANGTLRYFEITNVATAFAYFPGGSERSGDSVYNTNQFNSPSVGSYAYFTILHETSHAMGLEHAHEGGAAFEIDPAFDSMEFSVMTYNSFVGQEEQPGFYTNASNHYAQTLMMYDIAALQRLYGANWGHNANNSVYTFDTSTGDMSINGVAVEGSVANVIFRTIWDANGTDTYDFSNFATALNVDLAPGGWSDLDVGGNALRARTNSGFDSSGNFVGASEREFATAHVYNSILHDGDTRSLIENANGGSAADTINGNAANNQLQGNDGNDTLSGLDGADTLWGGDGDDTVFGGTDRDLLYGENDNDTLHGGAGKDVIRGNKGQDVLYGNGDNDKLMGGSLEDVLYGGDGGDKLSGQGGRDTLFGGKGFDRLIGGAASDTLTGGKAGDHFIFNAGDGSDVITDFGNGADKLHLVNGAGIGNVDISSVSGGTLVTWSGGDVLLQGYSGTLTEDDFIFV
jgi:serralysin